MELEAQRIREALGDRGRLTVLTGAGISAESGLCTFRDPEGLWARYRIEEVATPEAFARDPGLVLEFYSMRRSSLLEVEPNAAHHALVRLEQHLQDRFTLITQNVDNLHERAGSRRLYHMHGELARARCSACGHGLLWEGDLTLESRCARCDGLMRPDVVWFGEMPRFLEREIPAALEAEVFLAIGTSGVVYPAAGMVAQARRLGRLTVELNLEPSENTGWFDIHLIGPAGTLLPRLAELLAGPEAP